MHNIKSRTKTKHLRVQDECYTTELLNPIIIMGQCFALLPVNINKTKNISTFKFKWISIKMLYTCIIFIGSVIICFMCFYQILVEGANLSKAVDTGFYTNAVVTVALFTILAKEWSKLMDIFTEVDKSMNRTYGFPVNLRKKMIHTTTYFMVVAAVAAVNILRRRLKMGIMCGVILWIPIWVPTLYMFLNVEHVLSLTYRVLDCNKLNNCTTSFYYQDNYSQIFNFVDYSTILAILTQAIHFWCTFAWNYNNLFIMLMSTILAERFKQITGRIKYYEKFKFAGNFWSSIREDYDKLCFLCYQLDSTLSYIILSSYGTNLFFIIIQLYNSLMNNYRNATEKAYFFFSFGFLIFRTVAVSLYAAQINDASKEPTVILHSVPSIIYNEDIKRLLCQISFDSAVLTGCKMFKITRGLILNIAGAIVTYELVLIQFNAYPYTY